ncbi:MAG: hypothetical protein ABR567_03870 [Myxococcales bacterium]
MELRVTERVGRIRWIFLPLGMCALVAVGAHASADVVGDKVLFAVDRIDAFFDAIFSRWSVTAPLVDLVGLGQRTFFARAAALAWELSADALLAIPLLGYDERDAARELAIARVLIKRPPSLRLVQPVALLLLSIAGAVAVARLVQGSLLHYRLFGGFLAATALFGLLVFLAPRAVFRSLEHTAAQKAAIGVLGLAILLPLAIAAVASL